MTTFQAGFVAAVGRSKDCEYFHNLLKFSCLFLCSIPFRERGLPVPKYSDTIYEINQS